MNYLGIDLGGTNLVAGLATEAGEIIDRRSCPTPRGADEVAEAIAEHVRILTGRNGPVPYIGIGSPGSIDPSVGLIRYWSNLGFEDVPLSAMVRTKAGLPVYLENDANCAALGEYVAGAGKGSESMVIITLGTGIGCGAVFDSKLFTGFNHAGMEAGHAVIEYHGRPCTCGRRGCFETYCSATALVRQARLLMEQMPDSLLWKLAGMPEKLTGKDVFDALAQDDPAAKQVVREFTEYLASGVTSLVNIFQPEVFCIGGGISAAGEVLLKPVRDVLEREDYARGNRCRTRLEAARLGNDAGLIGAAFLKQFRVTDNL